MYHVVYTVTTCGTIDDTLITFTNRAKCSNILGKQMLEKNQNIKNIEIKDR